ncbi:copper amine oxidase [Paracoccidioides lutzii Pb01]|uniref:Amine oxidase n=1 Tax=Paracoccidioides lutzii (strain ATCC MYA-826 / Pb01) TaxID=502779 RepID=C1GZ11_PARBA|nr:copper amine oxidase [Paracoccidioides lutzii Pb01]EEH41834.2 copper amine oxidase [Paracoccidioides lutzii Pb01]
MDPHPLDPIRPVEVNLSAKILQASFPGVPLRFKVIRSLINLDTKAVLSLKEFPKEVQGPADVDEILEIEQLSGIAVLNDLWIYGCDDINETRRLSQYYMYMTKTIPQENHSLCQCHSPQFSMDITRELVRIDYLPTGTDHSIASTSPWTPVKTVEDAHDLLDEPLRTDFKPYIVQQPEGASFSVNVNAVKWEYRVGFNSREGLTLYNITYDKRNVFYRLSVSEMTVPYGDPRAPYHRKLAFDVGDVGFGITANQVDSKGNPVILENVVCLHEQDAGLQHKHTIIALARPPRSETANWVVQMICTISNSEYIFAWIFDQAGDIELEVRATGILSTMLTDHGATVPWGTNVVPGVMAGYHQHIFSMRIDPAIDGHNNTVGYQDSVPMPEDPIANPYSVGYIAETTVLKTSVAEDTNVERHRVFKIRNDNVINPISHKPVAYKLQALASQMMLMNPRSFNQTRAKFATKPIWVTKHHDGMPLASSLIRARRTLVLKIPTWYCGISTGYKYAKFKQLAKITAFGLTHNLRPEAFPIMPVERISTSCLKPEGFFQKDPAPTSLHLTSHLTILNCTRAESLTPMPLCHRLVIARRRLNGCNGGKVVQKLREIYDSQSEVCAMIHEYVKVTSTSKLEKKYDFLPPKRDGNPLQFRSNRADSMQPTTNLNQPLEIHGCKGDMVLSRDGAAQPPGLVVSLAGWNMPLGRS